MSNIENMDKLIKLLNLSTSNNDNEALSAIRTANAILKKNNILWDKILNSQVEIRYIEVPTHENQDMDLETKIEYLMDNLDRLGSAADFIESLANQFYQRCSLSEKQANSIEKFYRNMRSRRF